VVGEDIEALKKPQWGSPSPSNSSTAVHDDDHDEGVRQDWSDLLRAAYNRKCATGCAFEVVVIIAACTCLKI